MSDLRLPTFLDLERLALSPSTAALSAREIVRIGSVELQDYVGNLTVQLVERNQPTATLLLNSARTPSFDFFAPLTVVRERGSERSPVFTGSVIRSASGTESIVVEASGVSTLQELAVAPWVAVRVGPLDLIYMLARTSGFNDSNIVFEGLDQLPQETFEVVVPIRGVHVERALELSTRVRLLPPAAVDTANFQDVDTARKIAELYDDHDAIAVTYITGFRRLFEAEETGVAAIRAAIDWLTVQIRNGASHSSTGIPRKFDRQQSRAHVEMLPVAQATGILSQRRWLRDRRAPIVKLAIEASGLIEIAPAPDSQERSVQLAYASLARAANEDSEAMQRLTAIWDALEFYASTVPSEVVFSKSERRALLKRAREGLNTTQSKRLEQLVTDLNQSSLMQRIWRRADAEGARTADSDKELLKQLREIRNDAIHGRLIREPSREQLGYGVSIVARLLIASTESSTR